MKYEKGGERFLGGRSLSLSKDFVGRKNLYFKRGKKKRRHEVGGKSSEGKGRHSLLYQERGEAS